MMMMRAACASLLLAAATARDYEEGSFASLAPTATAHFADEFDRRGLQTIVDHGAEDLNVCDSTTPSVITTAVGTLHDDDTSQVDCSLGVCSCGAGNDQTSSCSIGYGDNLECGKHIRAPAGQTVSLLFTQFNLEQDADFVRVYDGRDGNAPVLGEFTGDHTPPLVSSTGRDMFVQFTTDHGNYGITQAGSHEDPGFYADWHFAAHLDNMGICASDWTDADGGITTPYGTLHDDEGRQTGSGGSNGAQSCAAACANGRTDDPNDPCRLCGGYGDGLNCYTILHAPADNVIRFTFTSLNLEGTTNPQYGGTGTTPCGTTCNDPRGCDYITIFDGPDQNSPVLGTFSGNPAVGPSVVTSQEFMYIQFNTDNGNCGVAGMQDPGFFGDWEFVEQGEDICHPSAAVLHAAHGVLHDDDPTDGNVVAGDNTYQQGYGDNLDCGVRIRARKGETVNIHFTEMNLEGGNTFHNGINAETGQPNTCADFGADACDFVYVYDGTDANAPLLGTFTGDMTDNGHSLAEIDTVTSSGRNVFVRFKTDGGNGGINGGQFGRRQGFFLEWNSITDGAECDHDYGVMPNTGLIGHNNEFLSLDLPECQAACCARDWCKSIDFCHQCTENQCVLADQDASLQNGATAPNPAYDLYERHHLAAVTPALGPVGCSSDLASISEQVNAVCCGDAGCDGGAPQTCSEECAALWMPFAKRCSEWLHQQSQNQNIGSADALAPLMAVTTKCERTEYGRFNANSNHGRCSTGDYQQYLGELGPACCRADLGCGPTTVLASSP